MQPFAKKYISLRHKTQTISTNPNIMYKAFKIIIAAMLATATIGCGGRSEEQTKASAASLMAVNSGIDSVYNQLQQSYETFSATEMDRALEGFNNYLLQATKTIQDTKVGDDCKPLQDAISSKIGTMYSIASNEAKEQVRIYKIPDSDFTDDLRHQWDAISATVAKKVSDANSKVNQAIETINKKSKSGK